VVPDREAKSISTETTFAHDIGDADVLRVWLLDLVEQLAARLRRHGLRGRTVELKLRSSDFRTRSRSLSLADATDVTDTIWQAAAALLERSLTPDVLPLRLLGVGASKLTRDAAVQGDLFDGEHMQRQSQLDRAVDAIRGQFGGGSIQRGSMLDGRR